MSPHAGGNPAKAVGIALGQGPVYPVVGMSTPPPNPGGVADLGSDFHTLGWYLHKTLWAISPRYDGPVLIRGRRIDRSGRVRFGGDEATARTSVRTSEAALRIPAQSNPGWRYYPTTTLLPDAGCYAYQIDGTGFSDVIVFRASITTDQSR